MMRMNGTSGLMERRCLSNMPDTKTQKRTIRHTVALRESEDDIVRRAAELKHARVGAWMRTVIMDEALRIVREEAT
jgi:uncharacterized protein (DUF1778 family)